MACHRQRMCCVHDISKKGWKKIALMLFAIYLFTWLLKTTYYQQPHYSESESQEKIVIKHPSFQHGAAQSYVYLGGQNQKSMSAYLRETLHMRLNITHPEFVYVWNSKSTLKV